MEDKIKLAIAALSFLILLFVFVIYVRLFPTPLSDEGFEDRKRAINFARNG